MIVNNEYIINELSGIINEKINNTESISIGDIISEYNNLIMNHIVAGDKIKLPYANVSAKRRKVNTIMGNPIDFTYKIVADINKDIKDELIEKELKNSKNKE